MPHTIQELETAIQHKLDKEIECNQFPYLCAIASTEEGRIKIVNQTKNLIFGGMVDIDACFAHLERSMEEIQGA